MSLKSLAGGLVRIGAGALTGGIGGALGAAFGGAGRAPSAPGGPPGFSGSGFNMPFVVKGPGGVPLPGFGGGTQTSCPKGYHLNKRPLAACKKHGAVGARSICVRNRSMNPMNYRALTRGLRRIKRAQKVVRKLHKFGPQRRVAAPRGVVAISENLRLKSGN